jgi:hypothetical protein
LAGIVMRWAGERAGIEIDGTVAAKRGGFGMVLARLAMAAVFAAATVPAAATATAPPAPPSALAASPVRRRAMMRAWMILAKASLIMAAAFYAEGLLDRRVVARLTLRLAVVAAGVMCDRHRAVVEIVATTIAAAATAAAPPPPAARAAVAVGVPGFRLGAHLALGLFGVVGLGQLVRGLFLDGGERDRL